MPSLCASHLPITLPSFPEFLPRSVPIRVYHAHVKIGPPKIHPNARSKIPRFTAFCPDAKWSFFRSFVRILDLASGLEDFCPDTETGPKFSRNRSWVPNLLLGSHNELVGLFYSPMISAPSVSCQFTVNIGIKHIERSLESQAPIKDITRATRSEPTTQKCRRR